MHYTISASDGRVMSQHRTARMALRRARRFAFDKGGSFTISEFPAKHATGHVVMRIRFDLETDWRGSPLDFWSDGSPVI